MSITRGAQARRVSWLVFVVAGLVGGAARAELQSGPERYPGKFLLTVHPVGVQVGYNLGSGSGFKLDAQFAGKVAEAHKVSLFVGGEVGYSAGLFNCGSIKNTALCNSDLQIGAFVMATFEQFLDFALVPFARAGLVGDVFLYPGSSSVGGGVGLKLGGGAHYFVTRNIGLGGETTFTTGVATLNDKNGFKAWNVYGNWDFTIGARFAF